MEKTKADSTWDILAGTRFLLAMVVAAAHLCARSNGAPIFQKFAQMSAFGAVLCFFVISGFSIAQSLERSTSGFYRRRLLRIYPLYALAVIYGCVPDILHHTFRAAARNTVANLFFLQTFTVGPKHYNEVVWSLAVEAACYLLAPLFVRLTTSALLGLAGLSAAAFAVYPHFHQSDLYYLDLKHGEALFVLAWAWLAGFIYHRHRSAAAAGVFLMVAMLGLTTINHLFAERYQLAEVAGCMAILIFSNRIAVPGLLRRAMAFSGDLSYPFYLFHAPTFLLFNMFTRAHNSYGLMAVGLCAGGIGMIVEARLKRPARWAVEGMIAQGSTIGAEAVNAIQLTFVQIRTLVSRATVPD